MQITRRSPTAAARGSLALQVGQVRRGRLRCGRPRLQVRRGVVFAVAAAAGTASALRATPSVHSRRLKRRNDGVPNVARRRSCSGERACRRSAKREGGSEPRTCSGRDCVRARPRTCSRGDCEDDAAAHLHDDVKIVHVSGRCSIVHTDVGRSGRMLATRTES